MNYRTYARAACLLIFGLTILFLDFFSKAYVYNILAFYDSGIEIFRDFLGVDFFIALTMNAGAAWGMLADFQIPLLVVRILVILGMLIYLFFLNRNRRADFPLVLILAGALGNVVDFFLYGLVVDFFHFNLWGYHFPVFNLADTSITIGVIWLFIVASFFKKKSTLTV